MNGLETWNLNKDVLNPNKESKYRWNPHLFMGAHKELSMEILQNYPEHDENGVVIQLNHFLRKIITIPQTCEISERKILQIAFNIGQYYAECDKLSLKNVFHPVRIAYVNSFII